MASHASRAPNAGTGAFHHCGNSIRHSSRKATSRGHKGQSRGASASGTGDSSAGVAKRMAPNTVRAELVEAPFLFLRPLEERQPFDWLRANGCWLVQHLYAIAIGSN